MKKTLSIFFITFVSIFCTLSAEDKNSSPQEDEQKNFIFVGGGFGASEVAKVIGGKKDDANSYKAFAWDIRGGYEYMPIKYVGLRTYLDYMMSIKPSGLDTVTSSLFSLNLDVLANFFYYKGNAVGVYGGVGFGYFQHSNVVQTTEEDKAFVLGYANLLNFGISGTFDQVHFVELGAKIPLYTYGKESNSYQDSYVFVSYSYLF
ncbi:outer membrane beta-barrel protein [Helicobacter cappadocius]|uniref:Outer membrane beta-barrel protein n=1 Tax=Helicobacter cappadocius TaxID=3063998 RepID=A0AA90PJ98_9HELI|nr:MULTISPECIES: outer membrane beta-barrel protein [unclassified Helicobacter]MDO7252818.1 outer membrane beta-barrel protein [Helicobacter sp. faydin-H75]MDP2538861.1 outer membrane beta-barrel protein [Helicobacter sp. faydin-H76]